MIKKWYEYIKKSLFDWWTNGGRDIIYGEILAVLNDAELQKTLSQFIREQINLASKSDLTSAEKLQQVRENTRTYIVQTKGNIANSVTNRMLNLLIEFELNKSS